jgi:eukaryotic-like serine/threonine-protein kinase
MRECPTCGCCLPDDVIHCPTDGAATTRSITGEPILDGRYQLEKRLGSGGMGLVFKARHVFLKTLHAIKIILPDLVGNDPNLATRFRQEALASAAIRHQNIIGVTDFGITRDSMPFLVMEFVQGQSLQDLMAAEGAMPPLRAMELIEPICAGIAAAHRQNIIHRDLKPLNVMIQEGVPASAGVKILDFGLAKIKSGELLGSFVAAKTTGLLGSPYYMAPEQWSDEEPDAHADIYSLGVIFYQMLCAEVPFKGNSIPAIMRKHLTQPVPPLASRGVEVAPQLETAICHALEKDPKHRTASAEQFIGELRAAITDASAALKHTAELVIPDTAKIALPLEPPPPDKPRKTTPLDQPAGDVPGAVRLEEQKRAQEKLQREADAKLRQAEEQERKRQAEAAARERERQRLETIDRKQTRVLESQIPQRSAGVAEGRGPLDPEEARLQKGVGAVAIGSDVFSKTAAESFPQIEVKASAPSRKTALAVGLALSLVLLIGVGFLGYYALHSRLFQSAKPRSRSEKESPVKPDLLEIPGGTFRMGRNDGPPADSPAHSVTVSSFSMDKTEVTNSEYAQFVSATNHAPPAHWGGVKPPAGDERLPVSNVAYDDAVAFAEWRSKRDRVTYRLPTEEEWEYAARNGKKANLYPWGNAWLSGYAATEEAGVKAAQPVGTYPLGKNEWGVQDLIGNVWEWTSSRYSLYKGSPSPPEARYKDQVVIRGGGYESSTRDVLPVSGTMRQWKSPDYMNPQLGFRLIRPLNPDSVAK